MNARIKLQTDEDGKPLDPEIEGIAVKGVTRVELVQKAGKLARVVLELSPLLVDFDGMAEVYFQPMGMRDLLAEAVQTDGGHHKQYFLEQVADALRIELPAHEPGIAP